MLNSLRYRVRMLRARLAATRYSKMPLQQIFEEIYSEKNGGVAVVNLTQGAAASTRWQALTWTSSRDMSRIAGYGRLWTLAAETFAWAGR